jgi:uncharacterized membrane protein YjjB (DUF3815 family)
MATKVASLCFQIMLNIACAQWPARAFLGTLAMSSENNGMAHGELSLMMATCMANMAVMKAEKDTKSCKKAGA